MMAEQVARIPAFPFQEGSPQTHCRYQERSRAC